MPQEPATAAELRAAFGVTEDDVALNAAGQLAPSQHRRLLGMAALNAGLTLALGAGLLWVLLGVAVHPIPWWRWLLVGVLEVGLLVMGGRWVRRLVLPAREGVVVRHSGPVETYVGRGKHVVVDGIDYNLPVPLRLVDPGASYDVYVVELPAMVVAMVPTAAAPPTPGAPSPPSGG